MKRQVKAEIRKEEIPSVDDVILTKKKNIFSEVKDTVESELFEEYTDIADELLKIYDPKTVMSAALKLAFKSDLDASAYTEIRKFTVDRKGTARIFISIGRKDGYTARAIVDLVREETGLSNAKINDVKILDEYSFITVPYEEAEKVTTNLNKLSSGRPLAEIAKDGDGNKGGSDSRRSGRRSGGDGGRRSSRGYDDGNRSGRNASSGRGSAGRGGKPERERAYKKRETSFQRKASKSRSR